MTNGQLLTTAADQLHIPPRTVDEVRKSLNAAKRRGSDHAMAKLMLKHGRLTDEARSLVTGWE